jgi:SAM-dependent methyltransferase
LGKQPSLITPADLAAFDHFHIGGRGATLALLGLAQLQPGQRVLDLGGGLGGPARTLALKAGLHSTVLDFTPSFVSAGAELTRRVGLASRVAFVEGDATRVPFANASFDAVWTQHSSMNIPDKAALYQAAWRVLRPGGKLAFHEVFAGPQPAIHFPVPWASQPALSHLAPPAAVRALLGELGFRELAWRDLTAESREWWRARRQPALPTEPPVGLHLVLGPLAPVMAANLMRSLDENRVTVLQAVFQRPAEAP